MKKPKETDFKIGEPITNDERIEALNQIINERVEKNRQGAYRDAYIEWLWATGQSR